MARGIRLRRKFFATPKALRHLSLILLFISIFAASAQLFARPLTCSENERAARASVEPEAECIATQLLELQRLFEAEVPAGGDVIDILTTDSAARAPIMRLQRLSEVLKDIVRSEWRKPLEKVNKLSTALGGYGDAVQFQKFAENVAVNQTLLSTKQAEKIRVEFSKRLKKSRRDFRDFLESEKWLDRDESPLTDLMSGIEKIDWNSKKKAVKTLRKSLSEQIESLLTKPYNFNDLETGTHEFRKDLRAFLISIKATYGLVVLGGGSKPLPPELEVFADSKYAVVNLLVEIANPVVIPRDLFLQLVATEKTLGAAKDTGQSVEALAEVIQELDMAADKKSAMKLSKQLAQDYLNSLTKSTSTNSNTNSYEEIAITTRDSALILRGKNGPLRQLQDILTH